MSEQVVFEFDDKEAAEAFFAWYLNQGEQHMFEAFDVEGLEILDMQTDLEDRTQYIQTSKE